MAEIVLIQPITGSWDEMSIRFPESLLAVASVPIAKGYDVALIDQRVTDTFEQDLAAAVGPETVIFGITAITGEQIRYAIRVTKTLKEKYPDIPLCWGGIHAILVPEQTIAHPLIDYVVVGDGEYVFCELFELIRDGKPVHNLRGLVYKTDGEVKSTIGTLERKNIGKDGHYTYVRKNGMADVIRDMDALPPLPYQLLDFDKYSVFHMPDGKRSVTLNTSKGCPFRCKFCSDPVINEGRWRGYSAERVLEKVQFLYDEYDVRYVYFQDDYFPGGRQRFVSLLEGLAKFNKKLKWATLGIRADSLVKLTDSEMDLLFASGCHSLEIGIESGNERILKILNKAETLEDMRAVNQRLAKYDIIVKYTLIIGFPGEMDEEIMDTLRFAAELEEVNPRAYCLIFNFLPIVGTPFYEEAKQKGFNEPQSLEEWGHMDFDKWMRHYQSWISKDKIGWLEGVSFVSYFHSKNVAYKFGNSPLLRLCFTLYHPIAKWRFKNSYYNYCFEIKLQQWLVATKVALRSLRQKFMQIS